MACLRNARGIILAGLVLHDIEWAAHSIFVIAGSVMREIGVEVETEIEAIPMVTKALCAYYSMMKSERKKDYESSRFISTGAR